MSDGWQVFKVKRGFFKLLSGLLLFLSFLTFPVSAKELDGVVALPVLEVPQDPPEISPRWDLPESHVQALPSPEKVHELLQEFLTDVDKIYETFSPTLDRRDLFLKMVREHKIFKEFESGRFELLQIDGLVIAKFAPHPLTPIRILFFNLPLQVNADYTFNPDSDHFNRYIHRLHHDVSSHVLTYNFQSKETAYSPRPSFGSKAFVTSWIQATLEKPKLETALFASVSATGQSLITLGVFKILFPDASLQWGPAAITWAYCFILCTFTESYDRFVRRGGNLFEEIIKRVLIAIPYVYLISVAKFGTESLLDWHVHFTAWVIAFGDKFASTIYSFIPRVRDKHRISEGTHFGVRKSVVEREATAWSRQFLQILAIGNDNNPDAPFRHFGKAIIWISTIPIYALDLWYTRQHLKEYPQMREDFDKLNARLNPFRQVRTTLKKWGTNCQAALSRLIPR